MHNERNQNWIKKVIGLPLLKAQGLIFFCVVFFFGEGIYMVYTIRQNVYETIAIVAISLWHLHIQSYTDFGDKGGEKD